jgi:hypothetical protein
MALYCYYTSPAQEAALHQEYERLVARKQAEIDEKRRRTGVIQKYTARAYIHEPVRVFHVRGSVSGASEDRPVVYFGTVCEENRCPDYAEGTGMIYALDQDYKEQIDAFLDDVTDYTVTFSPSGKYGPTLDYCGRKYEMPAVIVTAAGHTLVVEDEDKYIIGVL